VIDKQLGQANVAWVFHGRHLNNRREIFVVDYWQMKSVCQISRRSDVSPRLHESVPLDKFRKHETALTIAVPTAAVAPPAGGFGRRSQSSASTAWRRDGVTVQNAGVKETLQIEPDLIARQIDTVGGDIQAEATKTGMIGTAAGGGRRARPSSGTTCSRTSRPGHCRKSGDVLTKPDAVEVMKKNLPARTIVTQPARGGKRWSAVIQGCSTCRELPKTVARRIVRHGPKAVVIKGIGPRSVHRPGL